MLVALKLDRVSRSARDTLDLLEWCKTRGKRIVTTDDGIDSGTLSGETFLKIAGVFADVELAQMKERVNAAREKLRTTGRWAGEGYAYGYIPAQAAGGWRLEIDDEARDVVHRIVAEYVDDSRSATDIARRLTDDGVPTPMDHRAIQRGRKSSGAAWGSSTVLQILDSDGLLGYSRRDRFETDADGRRRRVGTEYVHAPDGSILQRGEPLVSLERWQEIRDARERRQLGSAGVQGRVLVWVVSACRLDRGGGWLRMVTRVRPAAAFRLYCGAVVG